MGYKEDNEAKANDASNKLEKGDKGIKWDRSCTDVIFCLIFVAFIVCTLGVSFYAYSAGDPASILTPYDSDGNACGKPDQCSMNFYNWPQGTACPAPETGKDYSTFKIPADSDRVNAGKDVKIPKARDFTEYPFKYFTLTSTSKFWTAVCVKKCPEVKYTAKVEKGDCV